MLRIALSAKQVMRIQDARFSKKHVSPRNLVLRERRGQKRGARRGLGAAWKHVSSTFRRRQPSSRSMPSQVGRDMTPRDAGAGARGRGPQALHLREPAERYGAAGARGPGEGGAALRSQPRAICEASKGAPLFIETIIRQGS